VARRNTNFSLSIWANSTHPKRSDDVYPINSATPVRLRKARKHILITSAWFPSDKNTNGIFVQDQAEALARSGHQVTVLVVEYDTIRSFIQRLRAGRVTYNTSRLIKIIHKKIIFPLPRRIFSNPEKVFREYVRRRVLSALRTYVSKYGRIDLVHHHCLSDNSYVASSVANEFDIPYVFTEHSSYDAYKELDKFNAFESRSDHYQFVRGAAERIAVSKIRANGFQHIFDVPFICIPNMVSDLFLSGVVKRASGSPFTFICVAILDDRKRQDILLRAFAQVFKGRRVRLVFVGNGKREDVYKKMSEQLGISGQVEFTGIKDRESVRHLLDQAHVGVLCSDRETFGIALVEAMFRGIPVIATRSGGPEEVVTAEVGLLSPVGDEVALAENMSKIYNNYDQYDAEKIRAFAISRYSEDCIVRRLEEVYDRISVCGDVHNS
jgi:L-malate glycosyltransferase